MPGISNHHQEKFKPYLSYFSLVVHKLEWGQEDVYPRGRAKSKNELLKTAQFGANPSPQLPFLLRTERIV